MTFVVWTLPTGFIKFQNEIFKILIEFFKGFGFESFRKKSKFILANFYEPETNVEINSSK